MKNCYCTDLLLEIVRHAVTSGFAFAFIKSNIWVIQYKNVPDSDSAYMCANTVWFMSPQYPNDLHPILLNNPVRHSRKRVLIKRSDVYSWMMCWHTVSSDASKPCHSELCLSTLSLAVQNALVHVSSAFVCFVYRSAIAEHCDNLTAGYILDSLHSKVSADNGVTKFNISRSHVWEGARRAFLRSTYSPQHMMSVKFTDDIGVAEGAVDEGGPRREFLQLLVDYLASDSPLFTGTMQHKHLNPVHAGVNLHM